MMTTDTHTHKRSLTVIIPATPEIYTWKENRTVDFFLDRSTPFAMCKCYCAYASVVCTRMGVSSNWVSVFSFSGRTFQLAMTVVTDMILKRKLRNVRSLFSNETVFPHSIKCSSAARCCIAFLCLGIAAGRFRTIDYEFAPTTTILS